MLSDKRREEMRRWTNDPDYRADCGTGLSEALDEVDRLRAALQQIVDYYAVDHLDMTELEYDGKYPATPFEGEEYNEIAERALKGGEK